MSTSITRLDPRTPRSAGPHTPRRRPHALGRALALAVGAAAIVVVILLAFVWPTVTSTVKDLPIAVAGPCAQVGAVETQLDKAASGAFDDHQP